MTGPEIPWDNMHHIYYFIPELWRIEAGDFSLTVNGDIPCPINPLDMHGFYAEGNMEIIATKIPIDISRNPDVVENVSSGADFSPKEIQIYT